MASTLQQLQARGVRFLAPETAYVADDVAQIPQIELAVLMANENGFRIRIFSEEREAVSWLRYGEQ